MADTSLGGVRVARELDTIIADRGHPAMCVSDNGTEFTSMAMLRWSQERRVDWHYIAPGKPQQNAFVKLHWTPARRMLNETLFTSLTPCPRGAGDLEGRLQHRQATQRPRQSAAGRLRKAQRARDATGRDAALLGGLRAPSRCITRSTRLK